MIDFLAFDPQGLPRGYLVFLRIAMTAGAVVFGAIAIYGYGMADHALSERVSDIMAMFLFFKFLFFFAIAGVAAAMALILTFISYRCWRA